MNHKFCVLMIPVMPHERDRWWKKIEMSINLGDYEIVADFKLHQKQIKFSSSIAAASLALPCLHANRSTSRITAIDYVCHRVRRESDDL
jgi:hypothetical protein